MNAYDRGSDSAPDAGFDRAGPESAFTAELESFARSCLAGAPQGDVYAVASSAPRPAGTSVPAGHTEIR